MAINETDKDFEDKQTDACVLQKSERQQWVQERGGQSGQHVRAPEAIRNLQAKGRRYVKASFTTCLVKN